MPAGFTVVSASHLTDASGVLVANATISFQPCDTSGNPLSFRVNGSGQAMYAPVTATVTAGVFSVTLADTSLTNPVNICYSVTVIDNLSGASLLGPGYLPQPTGSTFSFDSYIPNSAPNALIVVGPAGPPTALTIGSVTTTGPGTTATAALSGTAPSQVLSLTIPQGPVGPQGTTGVGGALATTTPLIASGTGTVGVATSSAHGDHQHPTEVTNMNIAPASVSVNSDLLLAQPTSTMPMYPLTFTDSLGNTALYVDSTGTLRGFSLANYWQGAWSSTSMYTAGSLVYYGGSTYLAVAKSTNVTPTNASPWALFASAGATGSAGATTSSNSSSYKMSFSLPGKVIGNSLCYVQAFTQTIPFQQNWWGSTASALVNPTNTVVFTLWQNSSSVGTLTGLPSGTWTFASSGVTTLNAGDKFTVSAPSQTDPTLAGLSVTLLGSRTRIAVDAVMSFVGKPAASQVFGVTSFTGPVVFPADYGSAQCVVGTNPTATAVFTIFKNGSSVGSVSIAPTGVATFTMPPVLQCTTGDQISVMAPSVPDATLSTIGITIIGSK